MKKTLNLYISLLLLAAFCLPAFAQDETTEKASATFGKNDNTEESQSSLSTDNTGDKPAGQADKKDAKKNKPNKTAKKKEKGIKQAPLPDEASVAADTEQEATPAAGKNSKKAAAKKKAAKKKKKEAPVSEYKFTSVESAHTYKFDKRANPIVKAGKKKKLSKKTAAGKKANKTTATKTGTKLKTAKPIGAEEEAAPGQQSGDKPATDPSEGQ